MIPCAAEDELSNSSPLTESQESASAGPYPNPWSSLAAQPVNNPPGCTHQALILPCPGAQLAPTQTQQSLGPSKPSGATNSSSPFAEHRPVCSKGHPETLTSTSLCHPLLNRCSERCHPCARANHDHGGLRVRWELHSSFLHPKRHPDITCKTNRAVRITPTPLHLDILRRGSQASSPSRML